MQGDRPNMSNQFRPIVDIASEQPSARRFADWDEWSAVADVVRDSIEAVVP